MVAIVERYCWIQRMRGEATEGSFIRREEFLVLDLKNFRVGYWADQIISAQGIDSWILQQSERDPLQPLCGYFEERIYSLPNMAVRCEFITFEILLCQREGRYSRVRVRTSTRANISKCDGVKERWNIHARYLAVFRLQRKLMPTSRQQGGDQVELVT